MAEQKTNELFVKDDIIYLVCHGTQDEWTVRDTVTRFLHLAEELKVKNLTPKCIVDLSDSADYDTEGRNYAIEAMKKDAVPTAIVGTNLAMQTVVNFMTRLAGQSDKYKAFKTTEEGEAWLNSL